MSVELIGLAFAIVVVFIIFCIARYGEESDCKPPKSRERRLLEQELSYEKDRNDRYQELLNVASEQKRRCGYVKVMVNGNPVGKVIFCDDELVAFRSSWDENWPYLHGNLMDVYVDRWRKQVEEDIRDFRGFKVNEKIIMLSGGDEVTFSDVVIIDEDFKENCDD